MKNLVFLRILSSAMRVYALIKSFKMKQRMLNVCNFAMYFVLYFGTELIFGPRAFSAMPVLTDWVPFPTQVHPKDGFCPAHVSETDLQRKALLVSRWLDHFCSVFVSPCFKKATMRSKTRRPKPCNVIFEYYHPQTSVHHVHQLTSFMTSCHGISHIIIMIIVIALPLHVV